MIPSNKKFGSTLATPRERIRAFTLVELLIAAAITVVIVVMLGLMLGSLMSSASHASQRADAFRDARAVLQMIERDMATLVQLPATFPTPTPAPLMSAPYFALTDLYADPNTATQKNQQLYALVAVPMPTPTPAVGDMRAVGYYCRWDTNPDGSHGHYVLCRYLANSATIFQTFQNIQLGGGTYAPTTGLYTPSGADEVVAAYVWNFNVTMYKADGTVISSYPYICDPDAITFNALPAAIEISFNAMSPQAARTVMSVSSAPTDWMDTTTQNYQRLVKPHAYEFHTRINFQ